MKNNSYETLLMRFTCDITVCANCNWVRFSWNAYCVDIIIEKDWCLQLQQCNIVVDFSVKKLNNPLDN